MPDQRSTGPAASVRALGRTLLVILRTRVELLAIEGAQFQHRLGGLAVLAALGLISLALCVQLLVGLVVFSLWDTPYRLPAMAALAFLFAAGAAGCAFAIVRRLRTAPPALDGTLQALAADAEALA